MIIPLLIIGLLLMYTLGYVIVYVRSNSMECKTIARIKAMVRGVYPEMPNLDIVAARSSYTVDKQVIHLCMHDPETGRMYDDMTLLYVTLHELAHVISKTYSIETHNAEFRSNFNMLLNRAVNRGYLPRGFTVSDVYCSLSDY